MDFECKISLADCITWVLTIAGFAIAIYQFVSQMNKDRENRNKENKTTWFLNVIVLPHLDRLHKFYNDLYESLVRKRSILDKYRTGNHNDYIEQRANVQREIKNEVAEFFDFLNPLISSYSRQLGLRIQGIKNNLQDELTRFLEEENGQLSLISINIINNKQKLLQELNSELSINE